MFNFQYTNGIWSTMQQTYLYLVSIRVLRDSVCTFIKGGQLVGGDVLVYVIYSSSLSCNPNYCIHCAKIHLYS